tara:strand:+ start:493 stop:1011 length:519 start_codon:yes stop_codon:yes gene_type:complete
MKVKEKSNYAILCLVFLIGIIVGYSKNFTKTKRFHRTHAPLGIDLHLELTYLEDSIHYILSVTDFDQKKIKKYKFPYTNRIPIGIVRDSLPSQELVTILLKDKSGIAVLYKKSVSVKSFLSHYCGCAINFRGRIKENDVTDLKNLWKNTNQFQIPSSFLYDRNKMFSEELSF